VARSVMEGTFLRAKDPPAPEGPAHSRAGSQPAAPDPPPPIDLRLKKGFRKGPMGGEQALAGPVSRLGPLHRGS